MLYKKVMRKIKKYIKKIIQFNKKDYISKPKKLLKIKNNSFKGSIPKMINSKIIFKGKNNILVCEDNVCLENSILNFEGDNSIIYLSSNKYNYKFKVDIRNNSAFYIGRNCYFNNVANISLSEEKNIIIGKDCLFSINIFMRTADPHLIYDVKTHSRINLSKSIYIGDHVWIGQDTLLLKGTNIGSGTIIGAGSIVSNKILNSNSIYAGNKLQLIKENVFWDGKCVHKWTAVTTKEYMIESSDKYIYEKNKVNNFTIIEKTLSKLTTADERLEYINSMIKIDDKNRFSM